MGDFSHIDTFIRDGFRPMIRESVRLRAVFGSYNHIPHVPSGEFASGYGDLSIAVATPEQQDPLSPSMSRVLTHKVLEGLPRDAVEAHARENDRMTAMVMLERDTLRLLRLEEHDGDRLLVIYAGRSAWERTVDIACTARVKASGMRTLLLTCACDLAEKRKAFGPALATGDITHALAFEECGGRTQMRRLLDELVALWPQRRS